MSMEVCLDVGQGTIICVDKFECLDSPGAPDVSISFRFTRRGKQTNFQVKKRLERFVNLSLRAKLRDHCPKTGQLSDKRLARDREWMSKNISVVLP